MRQIKFRARRKLNGEWAYGCLILNGQAEDWDYIMPIHNENSEPDYWIDSHSVRVISETVGQFTGLHDKNGKEIYEGDIVKYGNDMPIEVVFKQEGCFTFKQSELPLGRFQISKMEVVGNIHENPELLPKKEEGHE